jgi:hypothetical protein
VKTGGLPLPRTEQIWNTAKGRAAILFAVPALRLFIRRYFGTWIAAHLGIDILTMDADLLVSGVIITLTFAAGVWAWINKRVPTWAGLLAILGASIYLGVLASDGSWRTEHFTEIVTAAGLGAIALAMVLWRVWCGLSPKAPNTPPVAGTEAFGGIVSNLVGPV